MWPILLISRRRERCRELSAMLSPLDRRLRTYCATDAAQALALLDTLHPMLALVSDTGSMTRTLKAVSLLHRYDPELLILAETPHEHPLAAIQVLQSGAVDCLKQPVAPWEWLQRCRWLLQNQRQKRTIGRALKATARCVLRSRERISPAEMHVLLSRADALHDAMTGQHEQRTGQLARLIAEALQLPRAEIPLIQAGAALHDVGKIGIPDQVLHKPGRYTTADCDVMRNHPQIGYDLLKDGITPMLRYGAEIALAHHEHFDGSGYPRGLAGQDIPLAARITAVADVFDALTAGRSYRTPMPVDDGIAHLQRNAGHHFDPDCVEALRSKKAAAAAIVQPVLS